MESNSQNNFIKDYGALIIAVIALIQPWLIFFYRLLFRRPRVRLYPSNIIEVGYNDFGPTIGLYGTLVSLHQNCFIDSIALLIRREKDKAEHQFNWLIFRSNQFVFNPNSEFTFEQPSGFIVNTRDAHKYNILFSDDSHHSEMQPFIQQTERQWEEEVSRAAVLSQTPNYDELYENFLNTDGSMNFYTNIQRLCYWEVGSYSVEIKVNTSHPKGKFIFVERFSLTMENVELLRLNAVLLLAKICNQPNCTFRFAYPKFKSR